MRKRQKIDSTTSARRHLSPLPANIPRARSNPNIKIQFKKSPKRLRSLSDERGEENHTERKSRRSGMSQDLSTLGSRMRKRKRVETGMRATRTAEVIEEEEEEFDQTTVENVDRGILKRRLRSADLLDHDTGADACGEESEEEEEIIVVDLVQEEGNFEMNGDLSMTDHDFDDFLLTAAPKGQLTRLLRFDLVRLYSIATEIDQGELTDLTKDLLVSGILKARPESGLDAIEESDASPRPFTSAEGSVEDETPRSKSKGKKVNRNVAILPVKLSRGPIRTRGSSSSVGFVTESEDELSISATTSPAGQNSFRARSLSTSGLPKPTTVTGRKSTGDVGVGKGNLKDKTSDMKSVDRKGRHGRSATEESSRAKGKGRVVCDQEEEDDWESVLQEDGTESDDPLALDSPQLTSTREELARSPSPIAHRTRHAGAPTIPTIFNTRLDRAAKRTAVKKIFGSAQVRPEEMEEDVEEMFEEEIEQEDMMQESTEFEEDGEEDISNMSMESLSLSSSPAQLRRASLTTVTGLSSPPAPSRKTRSSRSDPSDADIESGADDLDEEEESLDLKNATEKSLLRIKRDDLVKLCEARSLNGEGTKKDLISSLLNWRDKDEGGSPGSDDSTASNLTARAGNHTDNEDLPLLMQVDHEVDPDKPVTTKKSKQDEHEEVNGLDLESLQLQDKEIAFDKLTKLEKIGSGGFKDVYKGIYMKKSVAIADIRGHLTEMDIKELGLLRDLRHPNIVNFIGVSIPAQPSEVPVTIISELCSNGDLFDYLRGVSHPTFLAMLEIMMGIAKGLEYLHTRTPKIIHRDIKSSNVLITGNGVAKINDFGLARVKTSTKSMIRSLVGTVNWQAPELWVPHPRYNEKVDVYSVGLVYWEVLQWHQPQKRYPFEGLNEHAIYVDVGQKKLRPSTASMGRQWGLEIVELVDAMWTTDPANRPSMSQVVLELEVLINTEHEKIASASATGRKKSK